jgi:hypothetical protein
MKKNALVIVCLSCGISFYAVGQVQSRDFRSFNTVQQLYGQSTVSVAAHSVNGCQFNRFFAGVGTGVDFYYFNTVPLFAEFRYSLSPTGKTLQVYANAGTHIPFGNHNRRVSQKPGNFSPGILLGAGIDYLVPVKSNAFIAGIGYSKKQVAQEVENNVWDPATSRINNIPIKDRYDLNRLYIKIGWVF